VSRLRVGEWTAALGAAALLVTLFLPWFGVEIAQQTVRQQQFNGGGVLNVLNTYAADSWGSGWDALGWLVILVALAAVACAAWLVLTNALRRPVAQAVAASVLTATVGTFAFVALALRALVFQPGPNEIVVVRYGAYLGVLAALSLAVGGWWAIKDERTDAPESAYTPPEPRPPPPARAA
jgi:threonine/homoserine/homoserine lactone efflux protein